MPLGKMIVMYEKVFYLLKFNFSFFITVIKIISDN